MLYKALFYRNPGIFCVTFHIMMQNPSKVKTGLQSNFCSLQSGVDLKLWRLFSGKNACTVVISWAFIYYNTMPQYDISWHNLSIAPERFEKSLIPAVSFWQPGKLGSVKKCNLSKKISASMSKFWDLARQSSWSAEKLYRDKAVYFLRKARKWWRTLSPGRGAL